MRVVNEAETLRISLLRPPRGRARMIKGRMESCPWRPTSAQSAGENRSRSRDLPTKWTRNGSQPYLSLPLFSFQIFPANSWNTEGKFVANRIMDLSELESLALDKKMERMERRRSKKKCFGSEIVIRMG